MRDHLSVIGKGIQHFDVDLLLGHRRITGIVLALPFRRHEIGLAKPRGFALGRPVQGQFQPGDTQAIPVANAVVTAAAVIRRLIEEALSRVVHVEGHINQQGALFSF